MRIGISILTHDGHNLWNNGIGQNVYHLASLLESIPFVERVVLLNCGNQNQPPAASGELGKRFPLMSLREASDEVDVAIEMSGGLDPEWSARLRARGGRIVFHSCGQPYSALIEPSLFNRPGFFSDAERCDEVWLLPKDWQFATMIQSIHRCPVFMLPYLWGDVFLKANVREAEAEGLSFGYKRGMLSSARICPAIFEPNISPIKMGLIPYLICEEIERVHPSAIQHVKFLNGKHMAGQHSFVFLMENSDLYKTGKVSISERDYFARIMAQGSNIVISHQIECPQNYLYLDTIAGNYPLIHNSPLFSDIGYFYPESDIKAGAEQFYRAVREHNDNLSSYAARSARTIAAVSPANRNNRDAYARRLIALTSEGKRQRHA